MSSDVMLTIIKIAIVFVIVSFIVFWISISLWVARDVLTRTHDKIIVPVVIAMTAILGPVGLVIYLLVRPRQTIEERMGGMIEQEMMLQASAITICPKCQRVAQDNFLACPHCGTILKKACTNCGKLLDKEWDHCAYCGADQHDSSLTEPMTTIAEETVDVLTSAGQKVATITSDTVATTTETVQSITVTEADPSTQNGNGRKSSNMIFGAIKWLFTPPAQASKQVATEELLAELDDKQPAKKAKKTTQKTSTSNKKPAAKSHPAKAKKASSRGKK